MWYVVYDDEPKGENIREAKQKIIKSMTIDDYFDFFSDNADVMTKIFRWSFDNGVFLREFAKEISDAEEWFFDSNAYWVDDTENDN